MPLGSAGFRGWLSMLWAGVDEPSESGTMVEVDEDRAKVPEKGALRCVSLSSVQRACEQWHEVAIMRKNGLLLRFHLDMLAARF